MSKYRLTAEEAIRVNLLCEATLKESVRRHFDFSCTWPSVVIQIRRLFAAESINDRAHRLNIHRIAKKEWEKTNGK